MLKTDKGSVISPILVVVKATVPMIALIIIGTQMFFLDPSACTSAVGTSAKGLFPECQIYTEVKSRVTADLAHE